MLDEGKMEIDFGDVPFAVTDAELEKSTSSYNQFKGKGSGNRDILQDRMCSSCWSEIRCPVPRVCCEPNRKGGAFKMEVEVSVWRENEVVKVGFSKTMNVEHRHFISLPCEEAHSGHRTGEAVGYSQKPWFHVTQSELLRDNFLVKELGMHPQSTLNDKPKQFIKTGPEKHASKIANWKELPTTSYYFRPYSMKKSSIEPSSDDLLSGSQSAEEYEQTSL